MQFLCFGSLYVWLVYFSLKRRKIKKTKKQLPYKSLSSLPFNPWISKTSNFCQSEVMARFSDFKLDLVRNLLSLSEQLRIQLVEVPFACAGFSKFNGFWLLKCCTSIRRSAAKNTFKHTVSFIYVALQLRIDLF